MYLLKKILSIFMYRTFSRDVLIGRIIKPVILLALLSSLVSACSSNIANTSTTLPAELATQHAQSLMLSGTVVPGTIVPTPKTLEAKATFAENLKNGLLDSSGDITACVDPNIEYLTERIGTFDPNNMSQIIQANTFQEMDGSTLTAMEKLDIVVGSYDVDKSQFVFLYIPSNIAFLPNKTYNDKLGQCLALIHIPDPSTLIPLFSGS
jgi:hypothetical protein